MILKHELIHYKRRDLWYKLLVLAATALHWFNPIVRLMAKAINTQCELSCDSLVIQYTNLEWKKQYCETIIKSAKKQMKFTTAISSYFLGGKNIMKNRILSIMDVKRKKSGLALICIAVILMAGKGNKGWKLTFQLN